MLFRQNKAIVSGQEKIQGPVPGWSPSREVPAEDLLEQIVEEIPTVFGRLVYLAAMRDLESGTYRHPILNQLLPGNEVDRLLRAAHGRIFRLWLEFNLRQQQGDLTRHLGYGSLGPGLLRRLRDRDAFGTLAPPDAATHEKTLFAADLAVMMNPVLFD